jgi:hypothetical protein
MKALRYDALRPTGEIANEIGITYRMAEYTIAKLLRSRSLFIRAIVNSKDPKGILFYSLVLELDNAMQERQKQEIAEAYAERTWWSFLPPGPMMVLNLFATSIGETEDQTLDASAGPM